MKLFLFLCFVLPIFTVQSAQIAQAEISGTISNLSFDFDLGTSPGTDLANASGSYAAGEGNNGFDFITEEVTVSLDGGRFVQILPPGSLTNISGGKRYSSTGSGIRLLRWMNNNTFSLQIRATDLSGMSTLALQESFILIGDDRFAFTPNSLPMAAISAPVEAPAGDSVIFSAANSSDFNQGDALTFTWSLLSKPIGSLSNIAPTGAAASLVTDLPGLYSVKLQVNDPFAEGISTVHTFRATTNAEDPPPPPSNNNGFIELSSDLPEYLLGESATILIDQQVPENVPDFEYFYRAYFNDSPVAITTIPSSGGDRQFITGALTVDGLNTFKVDLYIQDAKLADQYEDSIDFYTDENAKIDAALVNETDPAIIAELQAQKAKNLSLIVKAQEELEANRTKVGPPAYLTFSVN